MKIIKVFCALLMIFCAYYSEQIQAESVYDFPEKALELIGQGKFDEARQKLNENRRKQPDNPLILFHIAQIEEDYDRALWMYKEVELLADSTLAAKALYHRAEMVLSHGDLTEAENLYNELIDKYSGNLFTGNAYYSLGVISLTKKYPNKALEYYTRGMNLVENGEIRLLAAAGIMECHVALGDWEKALESALEALKEKDDVSAVTPRILEVIALSWRNMGNEENANKFTERLLNNYPYSYQAHVIREEARQLMSETEFLSGPAADDSFPEKYESTIPVSGETGEQANFSVQASAFTDRNNALRLLRSLREDGFDARVDMKTVGDTHYFVVQIGYFRTREEADYMAERVTKATGIKANVVILN